MRPARRERDDAFTRQRQHGAFHRHQQADDPDRPPSAVLDTIRAAAGKGVSTSRGVIAENGNGASGKNYGTTTRNFSRSIAKVTGSLPTHLPSSSNATGESLVSSIFDAHNCCLPLQNSRRSRKPGARPRNAGKFTRGKTHASSSPLLKFAPGKISNGPP